MEINAKIYAVAVTFRKIPLGYDPPSPSKNVGAEPRKVTVFMAVHPEKAWLPMLVTPAGIVISVSPVQLQKAYLPMLVTLSGIVTLVRLLQL